MTMCKQLEFCCPLCREQLESALLTRAAFILIAFQVLPSSCLINLISPILLLIAGAFEQGLHFQGGEPEADICRQVVCNSKRRKYMIAVGVDNMEDSVPDLIMAVHLATIVRDPVHAHRWSPSFHLQGDEPEADACQQVVCNHCMIVGGDDDCIIAVGGESAMMAMMEDSVPDLINDKVSTVQDIVLNLYHDQTHNKRPLSCHLLYIK
jgi:uncharacterized protein YbaR (Trm112 family)